MLFTDSAVKGRRLEFAMGEKGFVAACLEHRAEPAQIDDFVDLWHHSETDETLSEFLGMTPPNRSVISSGHTHAA